MQIILTLYWANSPLHGEQKEDKLKDDVTLKEVEHNSHSVSLPGSSVWRLLVGAIWWRNLPSTAWARRSGSTSTVMSHVGRMLPWMGCDKSGTLPPKAHNSLSHHEKSIRKIPAEGHSAKPLTSPPQNDPGRQKQGTAMAERRLRRRDDETQGSVPSGVPEWKEDVR